MTIPKISTNIETEQETLVNDELVTGFYSCAEADVAVENVDGENDAVEGKMGFERFLQPEFL